jgi:hypothetical protein
MDALQIIQSLKQALECGLKTGSISTIVPPKLSDLIPTNTCKAFAENVKRAYYQATLWRSLVAIDPPELDPKLYWTGEGHCF